MSADLDFTITPARPEDLDAIVALEHAIEFAPHWPRKTYAEMIQRMAHAASNDLQRHLVVAQQAGGQLIGFAACSAHPRLPESAVLESIAVASTMRRAGVGTALCEEIFAWCRRQGAMEIGLEVRRQSEGVIALYRALGFVEAGARPAYYADSADALVMRKDLTNPLGIRNR